MSDPTGVAAQLREIRARIEGACLRVGRSAGGVTLVAVSKTFPADAIRLAVEAGQRSFGESRLQEALPKVESLAGSLDWHFIGSVQRNKVRKILPAFHTIHAVDSLRLAGHVSGVARELGLKPDVFLQVNQGGEASKGGFETEDLLRGFHEIMELPGIHVLGLMSIPPPGETPECSRKWFRQLREVRDHIAKQKGHALPCLSMGMSDDFEVAVEEGATHVRVGSAIFGRRAYRVDGELG